MSRFLVRSDVYDKVKSMMHPSKSLSQSHPRPLNFNNSPQKSQTNKQNTRTKNQDRPVWEQCKEISKAEESDEAMDVYITPVRPAVEPKHGHHARGRYLGYTGTGNLLDFSACTIPMGFVDHDIQNADKSNTMDSEGNEIPEVTSDPGWQFEEHLDPEVYRGLAVTVQVVGRRLEEEEALDVVTMFEELLKRSL